MMEKVKLDSFLDFSYLSELMLSPGGRYAGFVRSQCDIEKNGYKSFIFVYDTAEKKCIQLTDGGKERSFIWLNDRELLFPSGTSGKFLELSTEYSIVTPDGGEARPAFSVPLLSEGIKHIGYDLFVIQAKTTLYPPEDLPETGASWAVVDELPFVENGAGYVSGMRHRLFLYHSSTGELSPITGERFLLRGNFAVSPDGSMIAYMGMDMDYREEEKLGVFVYDINKGETKQLLPPWQIQAAPCGLYRRQGAVHRSRRKTLRLVPERLVLQTGPKDRQ